MFPCPRWGWGEGSRFKHFFGCFLYIFQDAPERKILCAEYCWTSFLWLPCHSTSLPAHREERKKDSHGNEASLIPAFPAYIFSLCMAHSLPQIVPLSLQPGEWQQMELKDCLCAYAQARQGVGEMQHPEAGKTCSSFLCSFWEQDRVWFCMTFGKQITWDTPVAHRRDLISLQ